MHMYSYVLNLQNEFIKNFSSEVNNLFFKQTNKVCSKILSHK